MLIIRALRNPLNALNFLDMRFLRCIFMVCLLLASVVLTPAVCSAQQRSLERATLPDSLSRSYRHSEAIKRLTIDGDTITVYGIWQDIVAQDSSYAPALYYLHLLEDDKLKALEYARRAYAADTTNKWYARGYAHSLLAMEKYSQAIPIYRHIIRLAPKELGAYHTLAMLYSYNKMPYSAISVIDSAELRVGYNPYLGEMKLRLLIDTRQYDKAIATGIKCVEENPYDASALINLADAYEIAGRDSLARVTLDGAFKIDSTNVNTLLALSDFYDRKGDANRMLDYEERLLADRNLPVEEKLRRVDILTSNRAFYTKNYIRIEGIIQRLAIAYPNNRAVADCYANHMLAIGAIEQAAEYLREHLSNEGTTVQHYIELLQIYHYLRQEDELFELLTSAHRIYPQNVELISFSGFIALERDVHKIAIQFFKDGIKVSEDDSQRSDMWGYIGDTYHEIGRDNMAFKAYRKALAYNPDNVLVLNNYAYFLSLLDRDLELALVMAERAVKLDPGNASYIDTYAWVLHRLGRNDEAKSFMSQALSLSAQREPSLLVHYADILWALGEKFMADTYWKKAVDKGYDKDALDEHIAELKDHATQKKRNKR